MNKNEFYFLGIITRKHGLQGNVVLKLDTDQPELYHQLDTILIEINGLLVPFFIEKQQWQKSDTKIISFKNGNEKLVDQTIGKNVYLPLSTLPKLSGNQFYYHEVLGFEILDQQEKSCGHITAINDQTAQHYFILQLNSKEILIPIIKDWILNVDRDNKKIKMQLPDGLLDVFID